MSLSASGSVRGNFSMLCILYTEETLSEGCANQGNLVWLPKCSGFLMCSGFLWRLFELRTHQWEDVLFEGLRTRAQEDSYKKYAKKISYPDNILEMLESDTIQDKCQVYLELLGTCSVVGIHNTVSSEMSYMFCSRHTQNFRKWNTIYMTCSSNNTGNLVALWSYVHFETAI